MVRNFLNYLKHLPKSLKAVVFSTLAILLIATPVIVSAGWFPERPVKDYNNLADRVGFDRPVFNSFINTPFFGDERAFFDVRYASQTTGQAYSDQVTNVKPGDELVLRTYVHNGANPALNASGQGVAKNTQVRILLPTGTAQNLRATSFISADNATPGTVSDTTNFQGTQPFSLEYVPGSAKIATDGAAHGATLADSIVTTGAPIGYNAINGEVPGCFEFQAQVFIKVKVKAPALEFKKQVALEGQPFTEQVEAQPGQTVSWLLSFKNAGSAQINNVNLKDTLPPNVTLVPGSVSLTDAAHPNGLPLPDNDLFDANGVNAGSYTAGSNGFIKFKTKVNSADKLPECVNTLTNVSSITADDVPPQEDQAVVVVKKECKPVVQFVCDNLTASPNSGKPPLNVVFTATGTVSEGVSIEGYLFDFGDGSSQVFSTSNVVEHTYTKEGTYTANVLIKTSQGFTKPEANCKVVITVSKQPPPPCVENCVPPVTPPPAPPPTGFLPDTGPAETAAAGFLGSGGLGAAIYSFVRSRRGLSGAIKNV